MRIRNVRSAALLWGAAIFAGCKGTEPPVATTIVVTPGSVSFATINATQSLTAKVLDQRGDSIPAQVITWSVDNAAIATVSTAGVATAKGNGTATITAASGAATQPVTVTVAQVASAMSKAGDAQTGTVGAALGSNIAVHVQDAGGSPVAGATVAFSVASGGGALVGAATTTNASGDATAGWTLGTVAGSAQAVNVTSGTLTASFAATANAGPTAAITPQAGNNQTRVTGLPVPIAPSIKVVDAFGNAKPNATVLFTVASGGGSVTGAGQTTDAAGIATVGSWTMGPAAGTNTLTATAQGTAISFTFTATATAPGAPTTMTMLASSNNQTGLIGYGTNVRPAVTVTDAGGQPVAGVSVTFAVTGGGGGVTTAVVNTNAFGIAQVGAWTLGAVAGANTMTATAAPGGITGNPANFAATGVSSSYNIVIQPYGPAFSPTIQAAFDSAEAAWEAVIIGDQSDVPINTTTACGVGQTISTTVDDIIILATFEPIDGPSGILGSAGACSIRVSNSLTIYGLMRFDIADTTLLSQGGNLNRVILHEMGHVLGYSSGIWNTQAGITQQHTCAQLLTTAGGPQDTHFNCPITLARFDSIGGTTYSGGNKVPLENCVGIVQTCGAGTFNSHWRELVFGTELMTGYFNSGQQNPFSVLTITTFEDIGYQVNYGAAEAYIKVFTAPSANLRSAGPMIDLSNDRLLVPIQVVDDRTGRVVRVIQP